MIEYERKALQGVPDYRAAELLPKRSEYCLLIPVINEGARILTELGRAQTAGVDTLCDIVICDGGSTDGSMKLDTLQLYGVNTLLTKTGPGKQGAQLRMGIYFALNRGYKGVLTIDGNNKDSIEDVHKFIEKLQAGYDFVLLQQYGVPFVAIGRIENDDIPQADNDQLGAASEMTRVLFQMGARRIAYLGGSGTYTVNADRLRGYLRGLAEFGVPADQSLIRTGIESDEQRTDALEAVLEQHPDCLLCCDDRIAFDLMRELRNRHIRVPEQLRLASLYDSELLAGTTPAISAVQFDAERLGSTACRMLLDVMAGKDIPLRQVQGYQVILRESTK